MNKEWEDTEETKEFMSNFKLLKDWFALEELETSDFLLGRMASRLTSFLASQRETLAGEIEDMKKDPPDIGEEFGIASYNNALTDAAAHIRKQ